MSTNITVIESMDGAIMNAHAELKQRFEGMLKLDVFPKIVVEELPPQGITLPVTSMSYEKEIVNGKIKSITPDTIFIDPNQLGVHLNILGFGVDVSIDEFLYIAKEYAKTMIVYQLIKTHDVKYVYDRFIGDPDGGPDDIFKEMVAKEETLHYYTALIDFYTSKMSENKVGILMSILQKLQINFLIEHQTVQNILGDPAIKQSVCDIMNIIKDGRIQ